MRKRHHSRQAARRRQRVARRETLNSHYRRPLRYEPLEDRRLLALVTVNTLSDVTNFNDNLTTLREAIFATNLIGGADTIDFAPALTAGGPATILLTQGEIKITDALTLAGPGANLLTIDASGSDPTPNLNNGDGSRVFNLDDGNLNIVILASLRGLTLTGGDTNSGGGAVLSREQLSIEQTVIRENATLGLGGGILARFGNVSLLGSTLSGNVATNHGGGIYHRGDLQNQFATLTITDSTISGNTAGGNGGGIFAFRNYSKVTNSTISGNAAVEGGGIFENGGSLYLLGTTVSGNSSSGAGGGIRKTGSGWLDIGSNSTLSHNTAGTDGGGLSLGSGGSGSISNSTLNNNTANGRGGGVASESDLWIAVSTVRDNSATTSGGGVAVIAGTTKIDRSTLQHNTAREGGGLDIRGTGSSATITSSTILENSAGNSGGGINNRAALSLTNSTVRNNTAAVAGGGIVGFAANTTIFASTISNNSAPLGGGLAGASANNVFTITNSTISSNFATDHAAGIFSSGRLTLKHSTVTGNIAARLVSGVGVYGPTEIGHTIVAGNIVGSTPNDLRGNATLAFSLLGVDTGAIITNHGGNLIGTAAAPLDPKLGPLANNGGPTQTHALLAGSPAINAGDLNAKVGVNGVPLYDQRNNSNTAARIFNGRIDLGAFEYQALSDLNLVVDTLVDESDGNYSLGDLSLREATELANKWKSVDTISFDAALTANGPATILLTKGELRITDSVTINGAGADLLTIDASGNDPTPEVNDRKGSRVFSVIGPSATTRIEVTISRLHITGGDSSGNGGGILSSYSHLTIAESNIASNSAGEAGGGVSSSNCDLTIRRSTIRENSGGVGSGVHFYVGHLIIDESIISQNGATSASRRSLGGALNFYGTSSSRLEIRHTKVSQNNSGGLAVQSNGATTLVADSEISGNNATNGISARGGGILLSGENGSFTLQNSTVSNNSVDAQGQGGGLYLGIFGSSVIVSNSTIAANFGGRDGGGIYNRGSLQINHSTIHGNSIQGSSGGGGITSVNSAQISDSEISDNLGSGILQISGSLNVVDSTISGNSTASSGGGIDVIDKTALVTITRSQITNNSAAVDGGGIQRSGGTNVTLHIVDSTISGNVAGRDGGGINVSVPGSNGAKILRTSFTDNTTGRSGGGIAKRGTGGLHLWQSTISNNTAVANGGGIMADDGKPWLDSSTLSGNSAGAQGGGLWTAKTADLRYSTIAQNRAVGAGGGIFASSGPLTLAHTIVASNTAPAGRDVTGLIGTVISPSYSLIGSNAGSGLTPAPIGSPDAHGNLIGGETVATIIDPLLGPLANNGGFTLPDGSHILTHALLPGSPAINAGDLNRRAGVDGVPQFDERGTTFSRVVNGRIDLGAFEYQAASDLNLLVDTLVDESDGNYNRGDLSLREAIELANLWPSVDTIRFDPALTASGPATILLTKGELKVTGSVTIDGPSADLLTIDASGNDPTPSVRDGRGRSVFTATGLRQNINVAMSGLTVVGGDSMGDGGGIFGSRANLSLRQLTITGNSARGGGGGIALGIGSLVVDNSTISGNSAQVGGGVSVSSSRLAITNSTISGNVTSTQLSVLSSSGGGIFFYGGRAAAPAQLLIDHCTIADNKTLTEGAGIWAFVNSGTIAINNSTIERNVSTKGGGGISISTTGAATITVSSNTIRGNLASDGGGIAAKLAIGSRLEIDRCLVQGNTASGSGGGVSKIGQGSLEIGSTTISGNRAAINGGGVSIDSVPTAPENIADQGAVLKECTISENTADALGGGVWARNAFDVLYTTITGNRANSTGGGVFVSYGPLNLNHTIVATNYAPFGRDFAGLLGAPISANYSLIGSNAGSGLTPAPIGSPDANGNIIGGATSATIIDPKLGPLADNGGPTLTHALLPGSPAINAGDPAAISGANGVPLYDQRGAPFVRIYGGRIDMGAIESQPAPLPGDLGSNGAVDAADYVLWRNSLESKSEVRTATAPAFVEAPPRAAPVRRSEFVAARSSDYRPNVADHVLATLAASRTAPAQRAAIVEAVILDAGREGFAPTRRELLGIVDEAFAAFKKLEVGSDFY